MIAWPTLPRLPESPAPVGEADPAPTQCAAATQTDAQLSSVGLGPTGETAEADPTIASAAGFHLVSLCDAGHCPTLDSLRRALVRCEVLEALLALRTGAPPPRPTPPCVLLLQRAMRASLCRHRARRLTAACERRLVSSALRRWQARLRRRTLRLASASAIQGAYREHARRWTRARALRELRHIRRLANVQKTIIAAQREQSAHNAKARRARAGRAEWSTQRAA